MNTVCDLALAYVFAIMLPGPSMYLIIQKSLQKSSTAGRNAALGVVIGIAGQFAIVLMGLLLLNSSSPIFKILQCLCALYLVFLGVKMILNKEVDQIPQERENSLNSDFRDGFFVEFFNPLAFYFFTSIVVSTIDIGAPLYLKVVYWVEIAVLGFMWFMFVALFANKFVVFIQKDGTKVRNKLNKLAGCVFIFFGISMFTRLITSLLP
jgi:threonine/homoserine/homoserine lactone efflux protein